jgi:Ca2+ transporting ATPase
LQNDDPKTPLQRKLEVLADDISKFGLYSAYITFGVMFVQTLIKEVFLSSEFNAINLINHISEIFIVCVTIVVVAVPEGLPLAVTIALAYSVGQMKEQQNYVKLL